MQKDDVAQGSAEIRAGLANNFITHTVDGTKRTWIGVDVSLRYETRLTLQVDFGQPRSLSGIRRRKFCFGGGRCLTAKYK